ncbi:pRL2-11 [Streptomyces sp. VNUA116]|uniref:pRL2-11 n=1 Tax=Streptomyces sp. VNUA116 TaxID=3062449 RepID=UPI0026760091|nr:pRL2-11 [Streptomyces sp. VNUA116]WKU42613.1 pRL2-11 [Streptomyces sp. VNUA116]
MSRDEFNRQIEELAGTLGLGVGRLLSGRDMDGIRRTDATFFKPGRRILPGTEGPVPRRSFRAGWQRLAVRLSVLGAAGGAGYGYWQEPAATLQALQYGGPGAGGVAVVGGLAYAVLGRERRELMREWVVPLHQALAGPLGIPEQTDPRTYLHIPLNFSDDDAEIRIDLPVSLHFNETLVADLILRKLALEDVSFSWRPAGKEPYVLVRKAHRPPERLHFRDPQVRELVARMPESAPLIGLGSSGKRISVDLDAESPHVMVSAGTGGGKSVILRTIAAQLIRNGARAFVLDYKRISHPWARGVPGVTYCRDIAEIHEALIELGVEGRRRMYLAEQLGEDADPAGVGPRLAILLEEVNATMKQLARYWEKTRQKGDPKTSPAIDALAEILFMGRQVRLHVLLVAQSATARALGGPEMRENFYTRILARYSQNAWRMLAPEITPAPKSTSHIGRAQVVLGGAAHETQVLFMTHAEARAWAMHTAGTPAVTLQKTPAAPAGLAHPTGPAAGTALALPAGPAPASPVPPLPAAPPVMPSDIQVSVPVPGGECLPAAPAPAAPAASTEAEDGSPAAPQEPADELLGLRQAQMKHLPDITLTTLRWARANDPDFPASAGKKGVELLYRVSDLKRWARNRPRAVEDVDDQAEVF